MYSYTKFHAAKAALAFSLLHSPADNAKQIEAKFLRRLLTAAERGQITPDDVYAAVEQSGIFDLDLSDGEKDKIIADLWNIGDNYVGALSRQQAAELRRLRKLCILAAATNDAEAWAQIGELL